MACTNEITEETKDIQETRQNPEQDAKIEVDNVIVPAYEISDEETIVDYEGDFFRKSVFCTGGEMIYICGIDPIDGSYFIGGMPKGGNRFSKLPVELPENMRVFGMAVDSQERCHLLLISTEKIKINDEELDQITFETSDIWIIDKEGILEKKIDVSEVFATEQRRPFCFAIDYE